MKIKRILSVFMSFLIIFSLVAVPKNAQAEEITGTPVIEDLSTCYEVVEQEGFQRVIVKNPESGYNYIAIPYSAAEMDAVAVQLGFADGQAYIAAQAEAVNGNVVDVANVDQDNLWDLAISGRIVPTDGLVSEDEEYSCGANDIVVIQKVKVGEYTVVNGLYVYAVYGSYCGPVEGYTGGGGGSALPITEITVNVGEVPEFSAGAVPVDFMADKVTTPAEAPYRLYEQKVVDRYGDEVDTFEEGVNYYLEIHLITETAYFYNPQLSAASTSGMSVRWYDLDVYLTYPIGKVGGQPGTEEPGGESNVISEITVNVGETPAFNDGDFTADYLVDVSVPAEASYEVGVTAVVDENIDEISVFREGNDYYLGIQLIPKDPKYFGNVQLSAESTEGLTIADVDDGAVVLLYPLGQPGAEPSAPTPTPDGSTHAHDWATEYTKSATHHWYECTAADCDVTVTAQLETYAAHDFSTGDTCVCGAVKTHEHVWDTTWTNSNGVHWHECIGEGECDVKVNALKDGYAECEFDPETNKCECGAGKPAHKHVWNATPNERTKKHHWHSCDEADCNLDGTKGKDQPYHYGYAPHEFDENGYCVGCNWKISGHVHQWATTYTTDGAAHWYECTADNCWIDNVEYNEGYAKHTFDATTGKCKVCEYVSDHKHEWLDTYDKTGTHHFRVCTGKFTGECYLGNKHELKPGYEAHTFDTDGNCIVCEWVKRGHTHTWDTQWTSTDEIHYHDCTAADCFITLVKYNDSYGTHQLDEKGTCECGYHKHTKVAGYTFDENHHWFECAEDDGYKFEVTAHTLNAKGNCVCGYHKHTAVSAYSFNTAEHWFVCAGDDGTLLDVTSHTPNANGTCVCGYHEHVWDEYVTDDVLYHWQPCKGRNDGCDITDVEDLNDYEYHSYDANGVCECGKVKPAGDVEDITDESQNVGSGSIAGNVENYDDAVLSTEEMKLHEDFGLDVDIWLDVAEAAEQDIAADDVQRIKAVLNGYTIGKYLDIELWKQVETKAAEKVTELSKKITVEIQLPEELKNTDSTILRMYKIIRLHDGEDVAEVIDCSYDATSNMLSFRTDRFSYYTIVYKDVKIPVDTSAQETEILDTVPKTGDFNVIPYMLGIALVSGIVLVYVDKVEKKRKRSE